jgi:hypothetical protein
MTDLVRWQARLESHFSALVASRDTSTFPLFALEHGLNADELGRIGALLRSHLAGGLGLGRCWLVWVVYAAEVGYDYAGDEYWQSFEERTPGWELQHRDLLRNWFRKFQTTYRGVKPSGPWAGNFPIIAWPITHAVLPKYLQYQFAYAVYQLRFRLAGLKTMDSLSVGRLMAALTYDASTRFQQFLQQEELTGRILLSLLGLARNDESQPIYPPTLQRIVDDLEAVRNLRAWLKDTRSVVADRFKGIGQGSGRPNNRLEAGTRDRTPDSTVYADIRPRVFLRHSGGGKWTVALEVQSFSPVAALQPDLAAFLKNTRCKLAGASDMKPAGWVLSHSRVGVVNSWPEPGKPLLKFERAHAVLDSLLRTDCLLSPGPVWLFRVGPDGQASEILGRTVRPGFDYIVASAKDLAVRDSLATRCTLHCSGIHGLRLSLPSSLSSDDTRWLSSLGLHVARTIRVWPSGLPCRSWDGEGQSEWLTTEEPCFGIVHDHPVSAYVIELNGARQKIVDAPVAGVPTFIRLSPLPAGKHRLTVTARRHQAIADIAQRSDPEGYLDLMVREPEPWVPGVPLHTGLIVTIHPHDADLEDFWTNRINVSIVGPEGRQVACAVVLERASGDLLLSDEIAPNLSLPVTPETWRKKFASYVDRDEASWRYLEASSGRLHIRAGELGEFVARFHGDVEPLRWLTRHVNDQVLLRLVDDTDLPAKAECQFFGMENPAESVTVDAAEFVTERSLAPPGALYVVRHGTHRDALVVSHGLARDGLQGLGVAPRFERIADGTLTVTKAVSALEIWSLARLAGPLADVRRAQVTRELGNAIYGRLCGKHWAIAERTFVQTPEVGAAVDALQHRASTMGSFGASVKKEYIRFLDRISQSTAWYADLAKRFKVSTDGTLCEFGIRLAFSPESLTRAFGTDLDRLIKQATSSPDVIRGARFAALLCDQFARADLEQFRRTRGWE